MDEIVQETASAPEAIEHGTCPMCRESLKPNANACVWCGYLLSEEKRNAKAADRRTKKLGRSAEKPRPIGWEHYVACAYLTVLGPCGLVAGEGGVLTIVSALLLAFPLVTGIASLLTGRFTITLAYLLAGGIGTGLTIILLVAYCASAA